jgi:thiamine pyrophosphate-dependent acetolactate synthase large subunit-like protein
MDDGAYGAEVRKLEKLGIDAAGAKFPRRRLADVASALGVTGHAVESEADLDAALVASAKAMAPALIHVGIDPAIRQEVF